MKARNTQHDADFAAGQADMAPKNSPGAGGGNLKAPKGVFSGGDRLNKGRLSGGTERHYGSKPGWKPSTSSARV